MPINLELEQLYLIDKQERENVTDDPSTISQLESHTQQRLKRLKEILPDIDEQEIWNCHYIAYLFQHGNTSQDYKTAHKYAKKAVEMGSNVTKWLYAATLDRYLVSLGKKQKYGTQYQIKNGKKIFFPVDPTTTDSDRATYGIPPLNN